MRLYFGAMHGTWFGTAFDLQRHGVVRNRRLILFSLVVHVDVLTIYLCKTVRNGHGNGPPFLLDWIIVFKYSKTRNLWDRDDCWREHRTTRPLTTAHGRTSCTTTGLCHSMRRLHGNARPRKTAPSECQGRHPCDEVANYRSTGNCASLPSKLCRFTL